MDQAEKENAQGKIKEICNILKNETIEPAKQQAQEIVENAHLQAKEIIEQAEKKAQNIIVKGKNTLDQEKKTFESALLLAKKQSIAFLQQEIEKNLFNTPLEILTKNALSDLNLLQKIILDIVEVVKKQGLDTSIAVVASKIIDKKKLSDLIGKQIIDTLDKKSIQIGDFGAGVQLKLLDHQITIDITDESVKELIANYIREDFREIIFK